MKFKICIKQNCAEYHFKHGIYCFEHKEGVYSFVLSPFLLAKRDILEYMINDNLLMSFFGHIIQARAPLIRTGNSNWIEPDQYWVE